MRMQMGEIGWVGLGGLGQVMYSYVCADDDCSEFAGGQCIIQWWRLGLLCCIAVGLYCLLAA